MPPKSTSPLFSPSTAPPAVNSAAFKARPTTGTTLAMSQGKYPLHDIVTPHEHDVLSGRGNFVNYHAGNEHFRALVRKHKVAYVACPKPQKGKFSRLIVDEIRARNPPGRFLKQDPNTKLWHDIGEKKALDKTRQALREGAPEISKELTGEADGGKSALLKDPNKAALYGLNDGGLGGYHGAPELKNEPLAAQHAALNMMQQQQRMQAPSQLSRQAQTAGHPGQLYSGQIQRMQQQQQQQQLLQQKQQQQLKLQQQSLSRQLGGGGQLGGLGGQLGGLGGHLGGLGGMGGGMGGGGINPYANFQNDYDDLEPTPLDPTPLNPRNPYGQMTGQSQLQAQLQAQAQLHVQSQQLQQLQQQQRQQQQLQGQSMAGGGGTAKSNSVVQRSSLKDGSGRPGFPRENSEQSLQLGNAFEDTIEHGLLDAGTGGGGTDKQKQKMGNSSAHMSIMSLTVSELDGAEDVAVAGDLSSMFDSSLQISDKRASHASTTSSLSGRRKSSDEASKAGLLDMSVATIGNDTVGGLSSALGGDIDASQADMSFSHMFDESEKTNL